MDLHPYSMKLKESSSPFGRGQNFIGRVQGIITEILQSVGVRVVWQKWLVVVLMILPIGMSHHASKELFEGRTTHFGDGKEGQLVLFNNNG